MLVARTVPDRDLDSHMRQTVNHVPKIPKSFGCCCVFGAVEGAG